MFNFFIILDNLFSMDLLKEIECIFTNNDPTVPDFHIPSTCIQQLLRQTWRGRMTNEVGCRCICWRVLLGLISQHDRSLWSEQLKDMVNSYESLKDSILPSFDKLEMDPLSIAGEGSKDWTDYYKYVDLCTFIKVDLDRLCKF